MIVGVQELTAGTLLGHYKIVRPLGQGGMGVVYEAEDQKLGRSVAIKLLPEATGKDPIALERFWREARTASSLNHAGICTIYELNESGDQPFIVMELLEGQSLDKALYRRSMPYPKLLDFGVQAADALDAAHRKGILHRDIKPGNIFLSPSGHVKLLDFGLAKLEEGTQEGNPNATMAPGDDLLTSPGSAVGTIAYMSPEQARGEALDPRSDVFSLGVVLYELATGQNPFSGATTAVTFDHILNQPAAPPVSLNPALPEEFQETLNKTLEKDRELRLQSAAELRADLKRLQRKSSGGSAPRAASASGSGAAVSPPSGTSGIAAPLSAAAIPAAAPRKSRVLPIAFIVFALLAAAGFAAWRFWPRPAPFTNVSLSQITNTGTLERIALSGDGKFLAEVKNDNGQRTLWVRNIVTNTDTQILTAFSNEYVGLTFSPDANYLYFTRGTPDNAALHALYEMPVFGGTPRQLIQDVDSAPSPSPDGSRFVYLRWTPDGKDHFSEIHTADKEGHDDQLLYTSKDQVQPPVWSPQGNKLAWIELTGARATNITILDLSTNKTATIAQPAGIYYDPSFGGHTDLAWLPDGSHLVFLYVKEHADRPQIGIVSVATGEFHTLTNDLNAYGQLAISADGKTLATILTNIDSSIAYYKGDGGAMISSTPLRVTPSALAWADEDHLWLMTFGAGISKLERTTGTLQPIETGDIEVGSYLNTCPDGHVLFVAIPRGGGESRLFRMDADGTGLTQLSTSGVARAPYCTPDSQKAYFSIRGKVNAGGPGLWSVPVAGGTQREELSIENTVSYPIVSRDAKLAAFPSNKNLLYFTQLVDLSTQKVLRQIPWNVSDLLGSLPNFSPDGKGIVETVVTGGGHELLYQPVAGSPAHQLTEPTHDPLRAFAWSPSGSKLAALQQRRSSDVVLITDLSGKQAH
jgi:Tol biopolymer transport system component